ncbi:transposase [Streptomyces sp. NPDC006134]|uniref:transposase n=1 Tax=Streptomyces sp. NPDC006134 TaxID=3154467 RepID=UPI0033FE4901
MCRASGRTSRTAAAGQGAPDEVARQEKWRLAPGLLGRLADWQPKAPVVVADAGYGVSTPFGTGPRERGLSYVLALTGKEAAHPEDARPHRPAYGGLGPPTLPCYRAPPRAVSVLAVEAGAGRFAEVTWRRGSKGAMTSRFTATSPPAKTSSTPSTPPNSMPSPRASRPCSTGTPPTSPCGPGWAVTPLSWPPSAG